jgi:hypothetical protein
VLCAGASAVGAPTASVVEVPTTREIEFGWRIT